MVSLCKINKKCIQWCSKRPTLSVGLTLSGILLFITSVFVILLAPLLYVLKYFEILKIEGEDIYQILFSGFLWATFFTFLLILGFIMTLTIGLVRSPKLRTFGKLREN